MFENNACVHHYGATVDSKRNNKEKNKGNINL